jgi:hypothetical protein
MFTIGVKGDYYLCDVRAEIRARVEEKFEHEHIIQRGKTSLST